ncbi:putative transmembrane protein [Toxoplasma gondii VAND]|uniref:Putative transmembrane protein n=2 Tax=Toxoplasma gondii TaxID=5811 RepID=A0A086QQB5_TOXGO|nr:putative transmembrane protein [Toxoplasma gondii VAND]KFH14797.1 putative transmembrane protein [Toxoplasma gondii MAS]
MTAHSVRGVSGALLGRRPSLASFHPLVFPHCFSHSLFLGCRLTPAKSVLTRPLSRRFSPSPFSTSSTWNRELPFSGDVRRETWTSSAAEGSTPKQHRGSPHLSLRESSSPLQFSGSLSPSTSALRSCAPRPLLCSVGSSSPSPPSLLSLRPSSPSLFSSRSSFASSPLPSAAPPSASSYLPASVRPPQNYRHLGDPRAGLYLHFLPFWARVTQPPSGARFFLRVLPLAPLCCSAVAAHLVPLWGFDSLARDLIGWSVYYAATLLASWWGMHAGMQLAHIGSPRSRGDRGPRNGVRFGFVAYGVAALIAASGAQQVEAAESLYLLAMACGLLLAGDFASHHAKIAPLWFWKERFLGISVCLAAIGALLLSEQLGTRGRQTRLEF